MKRLIFIVPLLILIACNGKGPRFGARVAGVSSAVLTGKDSLFSKEIDAFNLWFTQKYHELKHNGYSNKNAWLFIDSATKMRYQGRLPEWYPRVKQETDSLMKEKSRYKRVRIV